MKKLSTTTRIIIAIGSLAMSVAFFVPVWSIYLVAPQYPEGLSMQIWLDKITGQVDIINGLNHYIGMKHINAEMFPEFDFMNIALGIFILLGLIVAATGKRKFLTAYLVIAVLAGIAAMVDFYMWGYDYGHNLNPAAAIQVPGLSYQPPLIGHKKLLNFDAYSYPDTGGWVIVAAVAVFFVLWFLDWRKHRTKTTSSAAANARTSLAVAAFGVLLLTGCTPKPEPVVVGKDACSFCKMTIMDKKFGGEIVTKKGKIYKFDDVHCIAKALEKRHVELGDIHQTLFLHYNGTGALVPVTEAEFVVSSSLQTPMGGNAAAFKGVPEAEKHAATIDGSKVTNWATLYNILVK